MALSRSTSRGRFTVVVLVMICLTLISIDTRANGGGVLQRIRTTGRDILAPLQSLLAGIADPVADTADSIVNSGDLKAENRRLREENERLRGNQARQADAERERKLLLDVNKLEFAGDIPRVTSRVVNTAPSNVNLTIEIDRGSDHGVAREMPVVVGSGLVGKVASVTGKRAVVHLLLDKNMSVAVRLTSTGTQCAIRGGGSDAALSADLVDPDTPVEVGEHVVTSGLAGGLFPPGIPVGRVSRAEVVPGVRYQDIDVVPAVDFARLEFVQVLLWRTP